MIRDRSNRSGFQLECDEHTCSAVFRSRAGTFDVKELRRLAQLQGWQRREPLPLMVVAMDFCPSHRRPQ